MKPIRLSPHAVAKLKPREIAWKDAATLRLAPSDLRVRLFDLPSLDVVRIIEGAGASGARPAATEAET